MTIVLFVQTKRKGSTCGNKAGVYCVVVTRVRIFLNVFCCFALLFKVMRNLVYECVHLGLIGNLLVLNLLNTVEDAPLRLSFD